MTNLQKYVISLVAVGAIFGVWALNFEGEFKVEFGDSPKARSELATILEHRGIEYKFEKDHLDRIWVVPDQSKNEEFEAALDEWQSLQKINKVHE